MLVRTSDLPEQKTAHGEYPGRKQVIVGRGMMPQVMQLAISRTPGPTSSADFDPPEGHRHPTAWEWYFILEGTATFLIGNESHKAEPGDFLAVPPNTLHSHIVPDGVELKMFYGVIATD